MTVHSEEATYLLVGRVLFKNNRLDVNFASSVDSRSGYNMTLCCVAWLNVQKSEDIVVNVLKVTEMTG